MRRLRKTLGVPVLKLPPHYLLDVVNALRKHEYDRDSFKDAVLDIFPGKDEKSVFRGMAIPSVRTLGLLMGFERETHLTSDGTIVAESGSKGTFRENESMRRLLREIELERNLHGVWSSARMRLIEIRNAYANIENKTEESVLRGDFQGRSNRWISYLEYFGIVRKVNDFVCREIPVMMSLPKCDEALLSLFVKELKSAFKSLARGEVGEPVLVIEEVRRVVSMQLLRNTGILVMRRDFDRLLTACIQSNLLEVHLHRSMGADEGLFVYSGTSYQSISL